MLQVSFDAGRTRYNSETIFFFIDRMTRYVSVGWATIVSKVDCADSIHSDEEKHTKTTHFVTNRNPGFARIQ